MTYYISAKRFYFENQIPRRVATLAVVDGRFGIGRKMYQKVQRY